MECDWGFSRDVTMLRNWIDTDLYYADYIRLGQIKSLLNLAPLYNLSACTCTVQLTHAAGEPPLTLPIFSPSAHPGHCRVGGRGLCPV